MGIEKDLGPDCVDTANSADVFFRRRSRAAHELGDLRQRPFYTEVNRWILMDCFHSVSPVGSIEQEAERLLIVASNLTGENFIELMFTFDPESAEMVARLKEVSPLTLADTAMQTFKKEEAKIQKGGEWTQVQGVLDWGLLASITQEAVRKWEHNPAMFPSIK